MQVKGARWRNRGEGQRRARPTGGDCGQSETEVRNGFRSVPAGIDPVENDSYPTLILLDRRGRVVSWDRKDQPRLRGPALDETLLTLMRTEK